MTHSDTKGQDQTQRSLGSKIRVETDEQTNESDFSTLCSNTTSVYLLLGMLAVADTCMGIG